MKNILRYFFITIFVSVIFLPFKNSLAQNPTYSLFANNFTLISSTEINDVLEFDIYILHNNPPTFFEYAGGQFFIKINPLVSNGGTMTYSIIGSDLPTPMQPRSPSIGTVLNPPATVLRLATNVFPGAGHGINLTGNTLPGTKIVRMRLANTASFNKVECFQLEWRNPPIVAFATKIFAYIGLVNTEITTPEFHLLDAGQLKNECIHPVELSTFSSSISKNNVTLNWTTSEEINNSGFEIERKFQNKNWMKSGFVEGNINSTEVINYSYSDKNLSSGKYNYRLKQIDLNGNFEYHYLQNQVEVGLPQEFSLSQNYPNPFNPATKIDFDLPEEADIKLFLYDLSGKQVAVLLNDRLSAGYHSLQFKGGQLSSGMYFYRIITNKGFTSVRKMVLLK